MLKPRPVKLSSNQIASKRKPKSKSTYQVPNANSSGAFPGYPYYLSEKQVSEITGISHITLRNRRNLKKGPPFKKLGARVLYNSYELKNYIEGEHV